MQVRPSIAHTTERDSCAAVSTRFSAMTAKMSENTNSPTLNLTTLSRRSVVAIIRGVSWPPAT